MLQVFCGSAENYQRQQLLSDQIQTVLVKFWQYKINETVVSFLYLIIFMY